MWTNKELYLLEKHFAELLKSGEKPRTSDCFVPGINRTKKQIYDKIRKLITDE